MGVFFDAKKISCKYKLRNIVTGAPYRYNNWDDET